MLEYISLMELSSKIMYKDEVCPMPVSEWTQRTKLSLSLGMHYLCGYKRTAAKKPEPQS